MSRDLRTVTRTMFEPGSYSSSRYRRTETGVDVYLPAPEGPFDLLRFKITDSDGGELVITVHFSGRTEITGDPDCETTGDAPAGEGGARA